MSQRDELRRLIQDQPRLEVRKLVGYGDGSRKAFVLPRRPVLAYGLQVFVDAVEVTIEEDFTVDLETGGLTFTVAPSDGEEITATYHFVALSDAELDSVLGRNPGSIYLAAAEAIAMLLAGRGRLINFAKADGRVDTDAVRKDLMALAEHYRRLGSSAAGPKVESFDYPPSTSGEDDD
jgi:hypothetical protein